MIDGKDYLVAPSTSGLQFFDFTDPLNPKASGSIEAYTGRVMLDENPWALVRGNFNDGLKLVGPFYEADADEECCRVDDDSAVLCEILPAGEL